MINCRSLLYWGVRSSLVLPQTPWSSFPDLMSYFFSFYCKTLFLFCLQQKPTSYALFLHKLLTSSQPPLPPPCSCSLMKWPLVALESHGIFDESALKNSSSLVTPNMSYNQSSFLKVFTKVVATGVIVAHIQGDVFADCQFTLSVHSAAASEFTSVCWARYWHVK